MTALAVQPFQTLAPGFAEVTGPAPQLVRVVTTDAHEGPVYVPEEDALYFTSVPSQGKVAIKRLALDGARFPLEPSRISVLVPDANGANGMALDTQGRLVVCEQGSRARPARIGLVDRGTGRSHTAADAFRALPFNSPNDVVVRRDGTIWFTDPGYGFLQGFKDQPQLGDYVYRYDPATGALAVMADGFDKPNGLAFSPDERVLYVGDSGANQEVGSYHVSRPHHIVAFDVLGGRRLGSPRLFAVTVPGFPDGIKVDAAGRVYASAFSGVQVFDPSGEQLGEVHLPGVVNFTFGGPAGHVLFITTDTAIWAGVLKTRGLQARGV